MLKAGHHGFDAAGPKGDQRLPRRHDLRATADVAQHGEDDVVGMPRGDMEDPGENYQWKDLSPMASDLNPGALEVWQADVNNLY